MTVESRTVAQFDVVEMFGGCKLVVLGPVKGWPEGWYRAARVGRQDMSRGAPTINRKVNNVWLGKRD
jgi:hypothetical protein